MTDSQSEWYKKGYESGKHSFDIEIMAWGYDNEIKFKYNKHTRLFSVSTVIEDPEGKISVELFGSGKNIHDAFEDMERQNHEMVCIDWKIRQSRKLFEKGEDYYDWDERYRNDQVHETRYKMGWVEDIGYA